MRARWLTWQEIIWVQSQTVVGPPSCTRLRAGLKQAGFPVLRLTLGAQRLDLSFWLSRRESGRGLTKYQTIRRLIEVFRASGFDVGFAELGIADLRPTFLFGSSLVGPHDEICEDRPPNVEP